MSLPGPGPEREAIYRYPGSRPFQDTPLDRKLFWGREEEAHELLHLTLAERLVVVFAESGLGKTSLINAGLLEALRERDFFPMAARVNDPELGPVQTLYRDIEEAIHSAGIELLTVPGGELETRYRFACQGSALARGELSEQCFERRIPLWLFFEETEFWCGNVLFDPVLVIDQFEELFTLQTPEKREDFIVELANLARDRIPRDPGSDPGSIREGLSGPPLKILLSLREDRLGSLEELVPKIPGILSTRFRLGRLLREQAREAIEQPAIIDAGEVGTRTFSYAPEAVEAILDFLSRRRSRGEMVPSDEVEPNQLQLICQHLERLIRKPGHGDVITLDDLGGRRGKVPEVLSGVLERYYDEQTRRVAGGLRLRAIRRLCETGLIVNGRRASSDGAVLTQTFGVTAGEMRKLTDSHLLRAVPRLDSVYYELAHDTLVRPILTSRDKRRQRHNRSLSWSLAAMLLVAGVFGGWTNYAGYVVEERRNILAELRSTAGDGNPTDFLVQALGGAHRADCLAAPEKEVCEEILEILGEAVGAAREIGPRNGGAPKGGGPGIPVVASAVLRSGGSRTAEIESNLLSIRATGGYEKEISLPYARLSAVGVDPSGELIATGTDRDDGTLRVWRRRDGLLEPITPPWKAHTGGVLALAFDPRHPRFLTSGGEGGLRLWSLDEGKQLEHEALTDKEIQRVKVNALAWGPDGRSIAAGGSDGAVRVWDGESWLVFEGHAKDVRAVAFDSLGRRLASCGDDGTLRVWDLDGGEAEKYLAEREDNEMKTVAWSPDGKWIATGGSDKTVWIWPSDGSKPVEIGRHQGGVLAVSFDPSGRYLASGGRDGAVRIWDPASGEELTTLENHKRYVNSVAFSRDGTLVSGSFGGSVRIASPMLATPEEHEVSQHDLTAVAMTGDGAHLASGSSDGTLRLWQWDAEDGAYRRVITPIAGAWGRVGALVFDPEGERFAAATADGSFRIWDLEGRLGLDFPSGRASGEAEVEALEFADRSTLASRVDNDIPRYWDLSSAAGPDVQTACIRLRSLAESRPAAVSTELRDVVRDVCGT